MCESGVIDTLASNAIDSINSGIARLFASDDWINSTKHSKAMLAHYEYAREYMYELQRVAKAMHDREIARLCGR